MPIQLSSEIQQLRAAIRTFVSEHVDPYAAEIDRTNVTPEHIFDRAREMGLFGLSIPESYGGIGTSELVSAVALEALCHGHGGVTFFVAPSAPAAAINLVGREDQRQRYLPDIAAGKRFTSFCLTEPDTGSDAAGIKTRAIRRDGRWFINGTKIWISRATKAEIFLVSAVTDPTKGAKGGITIFLIDKRKGLNIGKPEWQLGLRGSGSAEVNFVDCEAGDDEVLGEIGFGFDALKFILGRARLWAGARAVGSISLALELSTAYAQTRKQFGKSIGEFQAIKHKIADMAADLYTARLLLYQAAELFDQGQDPAQEAAYAKLFSSEASGRAADMAVQIHGAMGVSQTGPVERLYRDVRAYRIIDGTSDIQRSMIANRVQKLDPASLTSALAPGGLI